MGKGDSFDSGQTEDTFYDAQDFQTSVIPNNQIDLKKSIEDSFEALNLFLNNKYSKAIDKVIDNADSSIYHSLGYSVLLTLKALMTFDPDDKQNALVASKKAVFIANHNKRKINKFTSLIFGSYNYSELTEVELHSELCWAEANLVLATMKILSGNSYTDFIRVIFLVRQCYFTYKDCAKVLEQSKELNTTGVMRSHFETGTLLGYGMFNMFLSLLPDRILQMLKFVGFCGEKDLGLDYLYKGHLMKEGIRSPLCSMITLFYSTYTIYFIGGRLCDVEQIRGIIEFFKEKYPNSAYTFLFQGRFSIIQGSIYEAIDYFEKCIASQDELKHFHYLCYWELMWCYCLQLKWGIALKYINILKNESSWSKLIYTYHSAIIGCSNDNLATEESVAKFTSLPGLRSHFVTKAFPMEKFFLKKGARFLKHNFLMLPLIESMYLFGVLNMVYDNHEIIDNILSVVKQQQSKIQELPNHSIDDFMLAIFLRGVCYSRKNNNEMACKFFNQVINNSGIIKQDRYLVPFALVEIGLCLLSQSMPHDANKCFTKALKYKDHDLESRLHYSAQCALAQL